MDEFFLGVILGEKSLDEWDTFVDTYNKNGGSAVLEQVNRWYDAHRVQSEAAQ